jgi:hypothetical protein
MRIYIELPNRLLARLQDEARRAHRPPKHHLEWLLMQALAEPFASHDEPAAPPGPVRTDQDEGLHATARATEAPPARAGAR